MSENYKNGFPCSPSIIPNGISVVHPCVKISEEEVKEALGEVYYGYGKKPITSIYYIADIPNRDCCASDVFLTDDGFGADKMYLGGYVYVGLTKCKDGDELCLGDDDHVVSSIVSKFRRIVDLYGCVYNIAFDYNWVFSWSVGNELIYPKHLVLRDDLYLR